MVEVTKPRPRKLIALQYNYSDSEDEETREERKARIVSKTSFPPKVGKRMLGYTFFWNYTIIIFSSQTLPFDEFHGTCACKRLLF